MKVLLILSVLACFHVANSQVTSGLALGFDLDVTRNSKDFFMPLLIGLINIQPLPRMDYDGGYIKDIVFHLDNPDPANVHLNFSEPDNALVLHTENLGGSISG